MPQRCVATGCRKAQQAGSLREVSGKAAPRTVKPPSLWPADCVLLFPSKRGLDTTAETQGTLLPKFILKSVAGLKCIPPVGIAGGGLAR